METNINGEFKQWVKQCLSDRFLSTINDNLNKGHDATDVAEKIINSKDMIEISNNIKTHFIQKTGLSKSINNSRPQTSMSCSSDLSDDWSLKGGIDEIAYIVDQMKPNKPAHFRLAGYQALLETELSNISERNSWEELLKTLKDGLLDDSRSIFDASLNVHSKLLTCVYFADVYKNLMSIFDELYHSKKLSDSLPSYLHGINFKIFLQEKLFRLMKLIVDYHEEILKGIRTVDKSIEDLLESFITFVSFSPTPLTIKKKPLNTFSILSVLEPQACWFKKWMHGLITRKAFCHVLTKSPNFLQIVITNTFRGLKDLPKGISVSISDEINDVFISGDSIESLTFFHSLHILTELCKYSTGRNLLSDVKVEESFSITDFLTTLLSSLNSLAYSDASNGVYEIVRQSLKNILFKPTILYDAKFQQISMNPLLKSEMQMWPHTLDVLHHMLNTPDGISFFINEYRLGSASSEKKYTSFPVNTILIYAANVLKQPVAVMNLELVQDLFNLIEKLYSYHEIFDVTSEILHDTFYPSVSYFYSRLDKYFVENENKTQHIDRAIKHMLLNVISMPLSLQMFCREPLIFEELIRGSIAPLRASWSSFNVVGFISNSALLKQGSHILEELAPHVLRMLLTEINKVLEDPEQFHDPWENPNIKVFLHVMALFSITTSCFIAFMNTEDDLEDNSAVSNVFEILQHIRNSDSQLHYLALKLLKSVMWNLDIYIYLAHLLDFQNKLLEFQEHEVFNNETEFKSEKIYIINECSLLRHSILKNCFYIEYEHNKPSIDPEEINISTKVFVENIIEAEQSLNGDDCELKNLLAEDIPGLRDNNWVSQARKSFKASSDPLEASVLMDLLEEMQKAIPVVEWVDHINWDLDTLKTNDYWLPEEEHGIDLILHYAEINNLFEKSEYIRKDLKNFIQSAHSFISYNKSLQFEGFDWFLSTIFLICNGDCDKAIKFVSKIVHFPSAVYMWPALGQRIDETHGEEAYSRLLLAHILETIVSSEFPSIKFAIKSECGIDWWMICNRLLMQCFLGILPWNEIINYFAICILYTPDYIAYYCASLMNHYGSNLIMDLKQETLWPQNMCLKDFNCHNQIGFMDRLGKRYGGKFIPQLIQRKLILPE